MPIGLQLHSVLPFRVEVARGICCCRKKYKIYGFQPVCRKLDLALCILCLQR